MNGKPLKTVFQKQRENEIATREMDGMKREKNEHVPHFT